MKKIMLFSIILILNTVSHARIGRHNGQVNIGGGYQVIFDLDKSSKDFVIHRGALTIELGYLLHSVRENNVIHGFDLRADFTMGFLNSATLTNIVAKEDLNPIGTQGGFAMTYTLGHQFNTGRLMFDIIGVGLNIRTHSFNITSTINSGAEIVTISYTIDNVGLGVQYVLPGFQFIMHDGFTFGWRNKLELYFGAKAYEEFFGISSMLSFGITFGSGSQPWEYIQILL